MGVKNAFKENYVKEIKEKLDKLSADTKCKKCKKDWTKCGRCPVMMKYVNDHKSEKEGKNGENRN